MKYNVYNIKTKTYLPMLELPTTPSEGTVVHLDGNKSFKIQRVDFFPKFTLNNEIEIDPSFTTFQPTLMVEEFNNDNLLAILGSTTKEEFETIQKIHWKGIIFWTLIGINVGMWGFYLMLHIKL